MASTKANISISLAITYISKIPNKTVLSRDLLFFLHWIHYFRESLFKMEREKRLLNFRVHFLPISGSIYLAWECFEPFAILRIFERAFFFTSIFDFISVHIFPLLLCILVGAGKRTRVLSMANGKTDCIRLSYVRFGSLAISSRLTVRLCI